MIGSFYVYGYLLFVLGVLMAWFATGSIITESEDGLIRENWILVDNFICMGNFMGLFDAGWLGIRHTN